MRLLESRGETNLNLSTETSPSYSRKHSRSKPNLAKRIVIGILFIIVWAGLVAGGMYGSYVYLEQIKADLIAEVNDRNEQQLETLRQEHHAQITLLKEEVEENLALIQAEVSSLNELLIFTRDSAATDFDSSNQLYSQLTRLEQQLSELKKNLEILE